jgi:hypothetical protein
MPAAMPLRPAHVRRVADPSCSPPWPTRGCRAGRSANYPTHKSEQETVRYNCLLSDPFPALARVGLNP